MNVEDYKEFVETEIQNLLKEKVLNVDDAKGQSTERTSSFLKQELHNLRETIDGKHVQAAQTSSL